MSHGDLYFDCFDNGNRIRSIGLGRIIEGAALFRRRS